MSTKLIFIQANIFQVSEFSKSVNFPSQWIFPFDMANPEFLPWCDKFVLLPWYDKLFKCAVLGRLASEIGFAKWRQEIDAQYWRMTL